MVRALSFDLRYALRIWKQKPGFATMAVLTLALGIGAAVAVFSIVEGVLIHRLPYRDPARLVAIWDHDIHDQGRAKMFASYEDFEAMRKNAHSYQDLSAATWAAGVQRLSGASGQCAG